MKRLIGIGMIALFFIALFIVLSITISFLWALVIYISTVLLTMFLVYATYLITSDK
jgi:hypothetical protein